MHQYNFLSISQEHLRSLVVSSVSLGVAAAMKNEINMTAINAWKSTVSIVIATKDIVGRCGWKREPTEASMIRRFDIIIYIYLFLGHRSQRLQWPIVITRCPASVVCRLSSVRQFTFSTSSPEPLNGFWLNLVCMKYSWSFTSVVVFRPDPSRGGSRAGQK